jgi:hypothetical protein
MFINRDHLRRNILLTVAAAALMFLSRGPLFGHNNDINVEIAEKPEESKPEWLKAESVYFTIYYRPDVNIKRIVSRINSRGFSVVHNPPSAATSTLYTLNGPEAKMAYRFDMLFARVKEILDMFPVDIHINVKIFKNRKEINTEFCRLARSGSGDECRSFYIHTYDTIYTSEQDISDSVIAHEMTHALVDHYFSATPPEKMAEILATNVDLHLDD